MTGVEHLEAPMAGSVRTIGILGGGQLGRMLALAGRPLGFQFCFLEPGEQPPVTGLGDIIGGAYDNPAAVEAFARQVDVVTWEFENVPDATAATLAERLPVYPPPAALRFARDRVNEKEGFGRLGIPCAPWRAVNSRDELVRAVEELGTPAVLKTCQLGYDGKGQAVIKRAADVDEAWAQLGGVPLVLEAFVPFERELSIVAARGRDGAFVAYPLVENTHRGGVLVHTHAPAPGVHAGLQAQAETYARTLMDALDYVGVLGLELFALPSGELWANEVAPRVHNTGHWTQDGAVTCQFENHVRAIAGLPLGSTKAVGVTEMFNLLGTVPETAAVLAVPLAHLHLYDKAERPGRKLGHINVTGVDAQQVAKAAARVRALIEGSQGA
jgi:5-(carboxyamino)imidazole ribonucleotide synthase